MSSKASVFVALLCVAGAFSSPVQPRLAKSLPLRRRATPKTITSEWREANRAHVAQKFNKATPVSSSPTKRQVQATPGFSLSVTGGAYYSPIEMGTPGVQYNVVVDTGSSDLWLAATQPSSNSVFSGGGGQSQTAPLYTSTGSSTFNNTGSTTFTINYLGGDTAGTTAFETVSMGGITVKNQKFGVATQQTGDILTSATTGLIGMAWAAIATFGTPFWQASDPTTWAQPLFAFALARDNNPTSAADISGGSFTIGTVDSTQYKGDIQYTNIPTNAQSWWLLPMTSITVNGQTFPLNGALSAIDTGTTLLGGPQDSTDAIYKTIPGAQAGSGSDAGYYFYPCSTVMNVSISFGGESWPIDPADFTSSTQDPQTCMGALFAAESGSGASTSGSINPAWIIGDTFLKNVYSVYRFSPPSVGFATLASSTGAGVTAIASAETVSIKGIGGTATAANGQPISTGVTGAISAASPRLSASTLMVMTVGSVLGAMIVLL
ncbi:hypothetical protein FRB95_012666 [Tulasnella sp. JGI-2019a]|nr:hypothetical protein FRB93_013176 [Tulasnella sp. JGI-2019a]KAG9034716.1 hypothetical protein FRB95_012666 [Tulasnella sp. JGI-2019a]